ncbi:MAG: hypothetical protein KGO51_10625, partial [Alphaproteobacteria bacterium]|nr:hypothetical protein [Alphaproteobacteria bacterium]
HEAADHPRDHRLCDLIDEIAILATVQAVETATVTPAAPAPVAPARTKIKAAQPAVSEKPAPATSVSSAGSAEGAACAGQPTPADRTICGEPRLRSLQAELRKAYAEALQAHEDKTLLRQRELAWAKARDGVTDPDQLASLYRDRIAKLRAATAEALRLRHAPISPRTAAPPAR